MYKVSDVISIKRILFSRVNQFVHAHTMSKITLVHFLYNFALEYSNSVFLFVTGQDAVTVQYT